MTLVPDNGELAIVLRGDLGAILRFAAGKKNPDFLAEAEALDNLLSPGSLVAGGRNSRSLRNEGKNAKTSATVSAEVSQLSLVAGACGHWQHKSCSPLFRLGGCDAEDTHQLAA